MRNNTWLIVLKRELSEAMLRVQQEWSCKYLEWRRGVEEAITQATVG